MDEKTEALRAEIQKLNSDSLTSPFIGRKLTVEDAETAAALYKRQIEHMGCTNVSVKAALDETSGDIMIEASFTPPPAPIQLSFTVENKNG